MATQSARRGFTVVELLVVVAILAIIGLTVLRPMHHSGPASTPMCLSNQKQIALGVLMYAEDFKEGFPNLDTLPGNDGPVALMRVTNYTKNIKDFMCPIVTRQRESARSWNQPQFLPGFSAAFFRSNGNDYGYYDGVTILSFTNAILAERRGWINRTAAANPSEGIVGPTHAKARITAAFCDGHAELLKAERVVGTNYEPAWSAVQDPVFRP